jgi:hypothetical protein
MTEPSRRAVPGTPGRFVRPYALTGGRTRSGGKNLTLETLIVTSPSGRAAAPDLPYEQRRILRLCNEAIAVVELSALLGVPLGVARVLASDLHNHGLLEAHQPMQADDSDLSTLLERVLDGLRVL